MPYKVKKVGEQYKVVNSETGAVKGTHTSKAGAERQVNLLRGVEHGWVPTGARARKKGKK